MGQIAEQEVVVTKQWGLAKSCVLIVPLDGVDMLLALASLLSQTKLEG